MLGLTNVLDTARPFLRSELKNIRRYDISWRRRMWLYWHGFLTSNGEIWELTDETVDQYLSDLEYRSVKQINSPYCSGLKNKLLFHLIVSSTHDHLLPEIYGLVRDGRFVDINETASVHSLDELVTDLEDSRLVVKPVTGAKGDGVRIIDQKSGRIRINGKSVDPTELLDHLTENRELLVTEYIDQADYATDIYPDSTNTLRLLTMIEPQTGDPFVAAGAHRFGTSSHNRIDNWSAGGISTRIDLDSGALGKAVCHPSRPLPPTDRIETHPETGAQIAGVSIPCWERVKATALDLAETYGGLWPHVGWDIVVRNDEGSITVLEGDPQSIDADQQAHGPLLADDRTREFYEHHGVISDNGSVVSL